MQNFATYFAELPEGQAEQEVTRLKSVVGQHPNSGHTAEDIETMFKLMHGLHATRNVAEAAKVFDELKYVIDAFRAESEDVVAGLEYFFEWSTMALQLTPESMKEFVSLPLYREMLEAFDNGPEKMRYRGVQSRAQLLRHYNYWLGQGGNEELLADEDKEFVQTSIAEYDDTWDAAYEIAEADEDYVIIVKLFRNASQYYLQTQQPNDAIACLKDALEEIPKTPDYHPSDSAELLMQIGQLFMAFKKWDIAIRYFNQALEIYHEGGEELEMLAFQAEGWIEEANKKKG